jgi:hypothetical protein
MAELTKDELEYEIVRYDKQKLISYCLKLFETNKRLVETNTALHKAAKKIEEESKLTKEVNKQLVEMPVLKFIRYKLKSRKK